MQQFGLIVSIIVLFSTVTTAEVHAMLQASALKTTRTSNYTTTKTVLKGFDVPTACPGISAARFSSQLASGWKATKVAGGLSAPRSIIFDSAGNLLVIQTGKGVSAHILDSSGCISSSVMVVNQTNLNHGLAISADGKTLYASSLTSVFSWPYNAQSTSVAGIASIVVNRMYNGGHPTRTILVSKNPPDLLIVSHGSNDNLDFAAPSLKTARAVVKVFDLKSIPAGGHNWISDGYLIGYGLRNEVGLTLDGDNMLWGVENSSDDLKRIANGQTLDIHQDNPADELNYIGDVKKVNTQWFGYPTCYTVWQPDVFKDKVFEVGDQFVQAPNSTLNDITCAQQSVPPKLSFPAHTAPLDLKFDLEYNNLYVTFHGSWNRQPPTGFKVVAIPFTKSSNSSYVPKAASNSSTGFTDLWWNSDVTTCSTTNCFRPVNILMDSIGRMYITSDSPAEGEIFLLGKA